MERPHAGFIRSRRAVESVLIAILVSTTLGQFFVLHHMVLLRFAGILWAAAAATFIAYEATITKSPWLGVIGVAVIPIQWSLATVDSLWLYSWLGGWLVLGTISWVLMGRSRDVSTGAIEEPPPVPSPAASGHDDPSITTRPKLGEPNFSYESPPPLQKHTTQRP